ncbi:citrate lyase acyl carrier protein [Mesorhizobium sp. SARCC-RB16n]|uniref:citrate lyase acyl carrier protein n=1 Tax=Mesorhizobium sp. SARCC-RB16n TaxID=2116687 RepID=UPI00122F8D56|nr:citrate lyase acyl carrier protein [Mesorhizobium sp. SARCC-RB16n]KAA3451570.1 citrate lyase acyl carrier protein [Mesorhizobium sp. SARCC-RB16n]
MKIVKEAIAGTLESSDLLVKVAPSDTREIVIKSEVFKQFGKQIARVVEETLDQLSVKAGSVVIEDKGALDCVIRARVQAATLRGSGSEDLDWRRLS